jgi:tetratricopeptide repeat protein 21B
MMIVCVNYVCVFKENEQNLNVGAILGSSRAYMMLKQTQKAKNQLKRVISYPWNLEDADYLQQCLFIFFTFGLFYYVLSPLILRLEKEHRYLREIR